MEEIYCAICGTLIPMQTKRYIWNWENGERFPTIDRNIEKNQTEYFCERCTQIQCCLSSKMRVKIFDDYDYKEKMCQKNLKSYLNQDPKYTLEEIEYLSFYTKTYNQLTFEKDGDVYLNTTSGDIIGIPMKPGYFIVDEELVILYSLCQKGDTLFPHGEQFTNKKKPIIIGNISDAKEGIIVHQVNCQGVMGAGLGRVLGKLFLG